MRSRRALLFVALAASAALAGDAPIRAEVKSDFGDESAWVGPFVEDAAKSLVGLMANPDVAPPKTVRVELKKDANSQGIAGWATRDAIGFSSSAWPEEKSRLWIVAHELANQFTAHFAGAGGFPSDWWADGRSPFPEYVSCLVLRATGHEDAAKWRQEGSAGKPDHALYWKLHAKYGFELFAKTLKALRADGVDLGAIGVPWPAPDRVRSAYTIAYLSASAGTNLAALVREHGIGREPSDWKERHPEIAFVPYEVTAADVDAILAARTWLFGKGRDAGHFDGLRAAYRLGGALNPPASDSPVEFRVKSAFEPESEWMKPFLQRAARLVVDRLGGPDRAPPPSMDVQLDILRDSPGIGGGPENGRLHLVAGSWPKEPFRLWIVTRDLARMLFDHYGGAGWPADLWTSEAWGDAAASSLLGDLGEPAAAQWLDRMQAAAVPQAAVRTLTKEHGWKTWARLLELLRDDRIELAKVVPEKARMLYAAAYLSIAAGENLAPALRVPGSKFAESGISDADVLRVMQRRDALFSRAASEDARAKFRTGDAASK